MYLDMRNELTNMFEKVTKYRIICKFKEILTLDTPGTGRVNTAQKLPATGPC